MGIRSKFLAGAVFCAMGFLFFYAAFAPGVMAPDAIDQYQQALAFHFEDGHPPVMAWLWSYLLKLDQTPATLLCLHLAMFWGGTYLIFCRLILDGRPLAWLVLVVGFAPWIGNFQGVLLKDIGLAYAWMFATAILLIPPANDRQRVVLGLLFCLAFLYGLFVRLNAVFGALPLIWLSLRLYMPLLRPRTAAAVAVALLAFGVGANFVFNRFIARASHTTVTQSYMMLDDLRALSERASVNLTPASTGITDAMVQSCEPTSAVAFCYAKHGWTIGVDKNPPYFHELKNAWWRAVRSDPAGYIRFRLLAFGQLLRSPWDQPFGIVARSAPIPASLGIDYKPTALSEAVARTTVATADAMSFLFKPYFWLICSFGLMLYAQFRKPRYHVEIMALAASAALYILGYIPITPHYPLRYVYWSMVAVTLAGVLLLVGAKGWPNKDPMAGQRNPAT